MRSLTSSTLPRTLATKWLLLSIAAGRTRSCAAEGCGVGSRPPCRPGWIACPLQRPSCGRMGRTGRHPSCTGRPPTPPNAQAFSHAPDRSVCSARSRGHRGARVRLPRARPQRAHCREVAVPGPQVQPPGAHDEGLGAAALADAHATARCKSARPRCRRRLHAARGSAAGNAGGRRLDRRPVAAARGRRSTTWPRSSPTCGSSTPSRCRCS